MRKLRALPLLLTLGLAATLSGCGFNSIIDRDEEVKAAWSEVQNQYQRRSDLVPNLVNTVKGAAAFEQKTLTDVIDARSKATSIRVDSSIVDDPQRLKAFENAQNQLSGALSRLLAVAEQYPDLKASAAYRDLMAQLEGTENRIAVARRRFINSVAEYNKEVHKFPTMIGAAMRGKKERPNFEATTPGAEKAPDVKFSRVEGPSPMATRAPLRNLQKASAAFRLLLGLALLWAPVGWALEVPALEGRVNDYAQLLSSAQRAQLEERLAAYEQQTGHQFALLTIPTLEGEPLEDFSLAAAEKWRLGDKKRDDGLLLLVVSQDRKARIEVGYGLEGAIPDVVASRVIREQLAPHFRQGDYAGGIDAAFDRLMRAAEGESLGPAQLDRRRPPSRGSLVSWVLGALAVLFLFSRLAGRGGGRGALLATFAATMVAALGFALPFGGGGLCILGGLFLIFFLFSLFRPRRRYSTPLGWGGGWIGGGRGWGGRGGFGGGGFGGGGGGFGGGGASGSW